jgi:hypothetical protein
MIDKLQNVQTELTDEPPEELTAVQANSSKNISDLPFMMNILQNISTESENQEIGVFDTPCSSNKNSEPNIKTGVTSSFTG